MVFYIVKCLQSDNTSMARRASASEALRVIEQALGQGWTLAEITRDRRVIDEAAPRQDAEREMVGAQSS